jgi:molybdopterin/thiamine biosynthesis adenylyltransferase
VKEGGKEHSEESSDAQTAIVRPARTTTPWWVRQPERLAYEERALQDAGIPYERDEDAFTSGIARLIVRPRVNGEEVELLITFPDLYPFFRFSVDARAPLGLLHHQAGLGSRALCLLERSTEKWRTSDTVAGLLQTQLPFVLAAGRSADREAVADIEAHQAEPFSEWYPYVPAMLQIDGSWRIPDDATGGQITVAAWRAIAADGGIPIIHGAVIEVRDQRNRIVATADSRLAEAYGGSRWSGRWTRAPEAIAESDAAALFGAAAALEPRRTEPPWIPLQPEVGDAELRLQLRAILFPEEHAWRDPSGQGWVFVIRGQSRRPARGTQGGSKFTPQRKPMPGLWRDRYAITRAGRSGPSDLTKRVPELACLRRSCVAVVGLGCIGAPSALEFARAQVAEVRVMDGDIVQPGTVPRWPLGLSIAGQAKAAIIADLIKRDYPYTKVVPEFRKLGGVREVSQPRQAVTVDAWGSQPRTASHGVERVESDYEVLERFTQSASLVYDASAEFGVQYFLSEFARARGLPYIVVSGTQGGWGGRIVRVRPGITEGCWVCMQTARNEGSLPEPPVDPNGELQTEGCADPTFTASGFDMVTIAMQGVRLAISTLANGTTGGYPAVEWDVAILALRDGGGQLIAPTVQTFPLPRHPACPACAARR